MIQIELKRIAKRKDYTIGQLYVDGTYLCDTLEPTWRNLAQGARKLKGRTAIPEGRYPVVVPTAHVSMHGSRCWWAYRDSRAYASMRATRRPIPRAASWWDRI